MSSPSAKTHHERVLAAGGHRIQARLSAEAYKALCDLSEYHRLDQRAIIERLVMGISLGRHCGSYQQREGLSDSEMRALG